MHRAPDFFIVGHAKSGTTALYEMLRQHPGIFMPDLKEPHFLAPDMQRRFQPSTSGPVPETLDEYLALFTGARPDQLTGEASAFYLSSRTAASSISHLNDEARIIAIFREPVSYLRSLHLQAIQDHNEDERDLRRALSLEAHRRSGEKVPRRAHRPQTLYYSDHVRYTDQLARYQAMFPGEQLLVLIYEEYRADNDSAVRNVCQFLGVDDSLPIASVSANPTVGVRSQLLDDVVHRYSVGRGPLSRLVKTGIKALVPPAARRSMLHSMQTRVVYAPVPPPDEALMAELRVSLKPEVERFGTLLRRDLLTTWGYNGI